MKLSGYTFSLFLILSTALGATETQWQEIKEYVLANIQNIEKVEVAGETIDIHAALVNAHDNMWEIATKAIEKMHDLSSYQEACKNPGDENAWKNLMIEASMLLGYEVSTLNATDNQDYSIAGIILVVYIELLHQAACNQNK